MKYSCAGTLRAPGALLRRPAASAGHARTTAVSSSAAYDSQATSSWRQRRKLRFRPSHPPHGYVSLGAELCSQVLTNRIFF